MSVDQAQDDRYWQALWEQAAADHRAMQRGKSFSH
jgi:hypothetical protein